MKQLTLFYINTMHSLCLTFCTDRLSLYFTGFSSSFYFTQFLHSLYLMYSYLIITIQQTLNINCSSMLSCISILPKGHKVYCTSNILRDNRNHATASQHICCQSQARIKWEGCGRKGIRRKNEGTTEVGC